ncbi:hypothetical protein NC653_021201 [Populus alba x Populus x berolinensis]|uniref:Uncharacterized protein n=1 Tax=Populus alba x Populus x berolinensis TaxID=444605 RepID=A0AAD6QDJ1_9ROSI|nr:hypothetical protein NC653_021201 [Populus alba x Populus x berolinensis]
MDMRAPNQVCAGTVLLLAYHQAKEPQLHDQFIHKNICPILYLLSTVTNQTKKKNLDLRHNLEADQESYSEH